MSGDCGAAPQIRRLAVNAAERKLNAKTKKDEQAALAAMYAYGRTLEILLATTGTSEGIAKGIGMFDDRGRLEMVRFLGQLNADRLGFNTTEEVAT